MMWGLGLTPLGRPTEVLRERGPSLVMMWGVGLTPLGRPTEVLREGT